MQVDPIECAICFSIMVEPVRVKCGHLYCLLCIEKLIIAGDVRCPMDRKEFDFKTDLKMDKYIAGQNWQNFEKCCHERANRIYEYRKDRVRMEELTLNFGNHHTLLDTDQESKHQWTAFVTIKKIDSSIKEIMEHLRKEADIEGILGLGEMTSKMVREKTPYDNIPDNKIIKRVTFKLHPTFTPNMIPVADTSFKITRVGWGAFNITMIVEFHDYLNIETMELDHYLDFYKGVSDCNRKVFVDIDKVLNFEK